MYTIFYIYNRFDIQACLWQAPLSFTDNWVIRPDKSGWLPMTFPTKLLARGTANPQALLANHTLR